MWVSLRVVSSHFPPQIQTNGGNCFLSSSTTCCRAGLQIDSAGVRAVLVRPGTDRWHLAVSEPDAREPARLHRFYTLYLFPMLMKVLHSFKGMVNDLSCLCVCAHTPTYTHTYIIHTFKTCSRSSSSSYAVRATSGFREHLISCMQFWCVEEKGFVYLWWEVTGNF